MSGRNQSRRAQPREVSWPQTIRESVEDLRQLLPELATSFTYRLEGDPHFQNLSTQVRLLKLRILELASKVHLPDLANEFELDDLKIILMPELLDQQLNSMPSRFIFVLLKPFIDQTKDPISSTTTKAKAQFIIEMYKWRLLRSLDASNSGDLTEDYFTRLEIIHRDINWTMGSQGDDVTISCIGILESHRKYLQYVEKLSDQVRHPTASLTEKDLGEAFDLQMRALLFKTPCFQAALLENWEQKSPQFIDQLLRLVDPLDLEKALESFMSKGLVSLKNASATMATASLYDAPIHIILNYLTPAINHKKRLELILLMNQLYIAVSDQGNPALVPALCVQVANKIRALLEPEYRNTKLIVEENKQAGLKKASRYSRGALILAVLGLLTLATVAVGLSVLSFGVVPLVALAVAATGLAVGAVIAKRKANQKRENIQRDFKVAQAVFQLHQASTTQVVPSAVEAAF